MHYFSQVLPELPIDDWVQQARSTASSEVTEVLRQKYPKDLKDFAVLISSAAEPFVETLAHRSQQETQKRFGKTIQLFAPLYLSNECINICRYCGFSRNNKIPRITLGLDQVAANVERLVHQGFRSLLLVAGEHPKYVSNGYMEACIHQCLESVPSVLIEIAPMEVEGYQPLAAAGSEGVVVYQETYHHPTYRELHTAGPKKNYSWRLDSPERAYAAGFRKLGIGVLFGLYDWRQEAIALAAHARYLLKHCWRAQLNLSLLRLRPAAGGFSSNPQFQLSDRILVQLICALRLLLPTVGIVLSTRESPNLREHLIPLGITTMSAGSSTEPGGYSHFDEATWQPRRTQPGEQFHISDERSPASIAALIQKKGYEPIWKDFDQVLVKN